jgi:hypothetical protein
LSSIEVKGKDKIKIKYGRKHMEVQFVAKESLNEFVWAMMTCFDIEIKKKVSVVDENGEEINERLNALAANNEWD